MPDRAARRGWLRAERLFGQTPVDFGILLVRLAAIEVVDPVGGGGPVVHRVAVHGGVARVGEPRVREPPKEMRIAPRTGSIRRDAQSGLLMGSPRDRKGLSDPSVIRAGDGKGKRRE